MFDNSQKLNKTEKGRNFVLGFTLLELMVTISIAIIVTAISFANLPNYSSKLSLELLAQDIAVSIRQAQVYGTSIYGSPSDEGYRVFQAYGVHFPAISDSSPGQYKYALFADLLGLIPGDVSGRLRNNFEYDGTNNGPNFTTCGTPTGNNECLEKFYVTGLREEISGFCLNYFPPDADPSTFDTFEKRWGNCLNGAVENSPRLKTLDIVFNRPDLAANFFGVDFNGDTHKNTGSNIGIIINSPKIDYKRAIVVWANGQISIDK